MRLSSLPNLSFRTTGPSTHFKGRTNTSRDDVQHVTSPGKGSSSSAGKKTSRTQNGQLPAQAPPKESLAPVNQYNAARTALVTELENTEISKKALAELTEKLQEELQETLQNVDSVREARNALDRYLNTLNKKQLPSPLAKKVREFQNSTQPFNLLSIWKSAR